MDIPLIISVDDHVVEPPDLWTDRLPGEVRRPGPARRARHGEVPLRGRRVLLREGRRGRRLVRLLALRRPRLPVPEAVGRGRLPRPRRHARHLRRDPPRLLEAGRAPRRHGRQPHRRVDLLPQHAAALLRPDVPRARRQGARAPLRAGLQRLDDRRVVRGRGQAVGSSRSPSCRCGTPSSPPPRSAAAPTRAATRSTFTENPYPLGLPSIHDKDRYWDPFFQAVRGDRDHAVHAHRVVVEDAEHVARRAVHRELDAHVLERDGLDVRLHLLGHARAVPDAEDRVLRGPGRLDAVRARAGRQAVGRARPSNSFGTTLPHPPTQLRARPRSTAASSTTRSASPNRDVIGMDQIMLRDRLPARRQHVPAHQGGGAATSATRPASTTTSATSSSAATPSPRSAWSASASPARSFVG